MKIASRTLSALAALVLTTSVLVAPAQASDSGDADFRVPGVCNIFPWFC